VRAISGEFGDLEPWQERAYKLAIVGNYRATKRIYATCYYGTEWDGKTDRRGRRCTMRTCAANTIRENGYVWSEASGMRQVRDCGSTRNDRAARRAGADHWVDFWYPTAGAASRSGAGGCAVKVGAVIQ